MRPSLELAQERAATGPHIVVLGVAALMILAGLAVIVWMIIFDTGPSGQGRSSSPRPRKASPQMIKNLSRKIANLFRRQDRTAVTAPARGRVAVAAIAGPPEAVVELMRFTGRRRGAPPTLEERKRHAGRHRADEHAAGHRLLLRLLAQGEADRLARRQGRKTLDSVLRTPQPVARRVDEPVERTFPATITVDRALSTALVDTTPHSPTTATALRQATLIGLDQQWEYGQDRHVHPSRRNWATSGDRDPFAESADWEPSRHAVGRVAVPAARQLVSFGGSE